MNSREAFEAFSRALSNANARGANVSEAVSRDLPDLEQARLLLDMYFDDGTRPGLKSSLRDWALEKLAAVHEREPPTREHTLYHAMYGLSLTLAKEPLMQVGDLPFEAEDSSREDDLARQSAALKVKIDELESELDRERQSRQDLAAAITALAPAIENARRPLVQIGDIFAHNSHNKLSAFSGNRVRISFADFFGLSKPGVELVKALVAGVKALAEGIRRIAPSDQTKNLVKKIVAGARRLVSSIARHVQGNSDLDRAAEGLDEVSGDSRSTGTTPLVSLSIFRDRLRDGTAGPDMIVIPAGSFMMGSPESDKEAFDDEKPQRKITIPRAFALACAPVTFEEYSRFCAAMNREPPNDQGWGWGRRPIINVTWNDAKRFCDWLSKETGAVYRLPAEAEWEYACRAGTQTRRWWGDEWDETRANGAGKVGMTTQVEVYPPNPWGLCDTVGNVWEWCEDHYEEKVGRLPRDGSAYVTKSRLKDTFRVVRGGSWLSFPKNLRCATRVRQVSDYRDGDLGFRLAKTL